MQFSNLGETTGGKGEGMSFWRGQWNKGGNPQRLLTTCTPGKSGGMEERGSYCATSSTHHPLLELATVFVERIISDKNRELFFFFKFKHIKSNCGTF